MLSHLQPSISSQRLTCSFGLNFGAHICCVYSIAAGFVVCLSLLGTHFFGCLHVWPFHILTIVCRLIVKTYVNMQTYTHATCIQTCMHTCTIASCAHAHAQAHHTCMSTYAPAAYFSTISSFVDVSFVDGIQPMVCIPCLHMHLQSLCSTSGGVNAQMQCKCMCTHFTHKAHMICTCVYLWIVYSPWCMHHVYICICSFFYNLKLLCW